MNLCVYGAASDRIDKKYTDAVYKLGKRIAERGHGLVFGGGGGGVMGAAARGAMSVDGKIYGYIPEFFKQEVLEALFLDCTEITYTNDMRERKAGMENKSDGFIICPGGIGTFDEFFEILTLKQLGRHKKPLVIFNSYGYYDGLLRFMHSAIEEKFISDVCEKLYYVTDDADDALEYMESPPDYNWSLKDLKK